MPDNSVFNLDVTFRTRRFECLMSVKIVNISLSSFLIRSCDIVDLLFINKSYRCFVVFSNFLNSIL